MTTTQSYIPADGKPLLVRSPIVENMTNNLPNTSRYAWPRREELNHSRSSTFPSRNSKNPFFARHNPHPNRVRHLKGLLDVPVCTVIDNVSENDSFRFLVQTPTTDQMRQRPIRGIRIPLNAEKFVFNKEKAVPQIGLVPVTQAWRDELAKMTEGAGLNKPRHPYVSKTGMLDPPRSCQGSRMGSRAGSRPILSRQGGDLPPPSRQGEIPGSRQSGRPQSRLPSRQDIPQVISDQPENERYVLEVLSQILQTDSVQAIQSWLVSAPQREKELVMNMIRAVTTSDEEYRDGYNQIMASPIYEDQLLQQENGLEIEEIDRYNKEKQREKEEEEERKRNKKIEEAINGMEKPKSPIKNGTTKYEWSDPALKPSSPFIAKDKPRPGTAEAEIAQICNRLESRASARVFDHQDRGAPGSRVSTRPQTQQSVYVPPVAALESSAKRPPSHQSIKSQQSVLKSILQYKPEKE